MRKAKATPWKYLFAGLALALPLAGPVGEARASDAAGKEPTRDWTVLVYLNGDNSLDPFGSMNVKQMEKIGSTDNAAVVVQWASLSAGHTVRMLVEKDETSPRVTSPVLEDMGKVDMGDWRKLVEFIRWGVQRYPARHYLIDVWNHGSGWHAVGLQSLLATQSLAGNPFPGADAAAAALSTPAATIRPYDISWDDNTGHSISTRDLGRAMREAAKIIGHKVDIYGSDACLMAMAEIAVEMRDSVNYFLGSQELEPGQGWPYDAILGRLRSIGHASPLELALIVAQEFTAAYTGGEFGHEDVTFAAYDLSKSRELERAVAWLGYDIAHMSRKSRDEVRAVLKGAQHFDASDYVDLGDFMHGLEGKEIRGLHATTRRAVHDALAEFVISNHTSPAYSRAAGVSVWLPRKANLYAQYLRSYRALRFERETFWSHALSKVIETPHR